MNTLLASAFAVVFLAAIPNRTHAASLDHSTTWSDGLPDLSAGMNPGLWKGAHRIEGVWEEQVSQVDCVTDAILRSFRALNTFATDGSLIAINTTPPPLAAPALGSWWRISRNGDFGAKMKFFRFNPDGSFAGSQEVSRTMLLDPTGETLTGDITYRVLDASDQVIATGCAHETGMRFR